MTARNDPPAFPKGWLKRVLDDAKREADKWPRAWLEGRKKEKPDAE